MHHILTNFGVILICLGIFGFAYKYYPYKTEQNVAELGPLKIQSEHSQFVYIPPLLSGLSVAAGLLLFVLGRKR